MSLLDDNRIRLVSRLYFATSRAVSGQADRRCAIVMRVPRYVADSTALGKMVHGLLRVPGAPCRGVFNHKESEMKSDIVRTVALAVALFASPLWAADDNNFVKKTAADGIAEVELADVALERAASNDVKALANHIKQDHQQANEQLKSIASQKGMQVPPQAGAKHQRDKERLAKLQGNEFDNAYVKAMIKAHEKDIKAFEKQAKNGTDAELKAFASATLPKLREHLDHAKQIEKGLQAKK